MSVCGEKRTKIEIAAIYQITTCMSCPQPFSFCVISIRFHISNQRNSINQYCVCNNNRTHAANETERMKMNVYACVLKRERKRRLSDKYCCNKSAHNFVNTNVRTTTVNSEFQPSWCLCLHLHLCWPSPCMTNIGDVGSFFSNNLLQCRDLHTKKTIIAELNQTEMNILR